MAINGVTTLNIPNKQMPANRLLFQAIASLTGKKEVILIVLIVVSMTF